MSDIVAEKELLKGVLVKLSKEEIQRRLDKRNVAKSKSMNRNKAMLVSSVMGDYKGRRVKVGVFIGMVDKVSGQIRTGWSRVKYHAGDTFNMDRGIENAMVNLMADAPTPIMANKTHQDEFFHEYIYFRERCKFYFAGHSLIGEVQRRLLVCL